MKTRKLKITMVGTQGVGKTWYLAAMYKVLGRDGVDGFMLKTSRELDSLLGKYWDEISDSGLDEESDGKKVALQGTAKRLPLDFTLTYRDQFIADINYVDYRGGAIDDIETGDGVQDFMRDLDNSDGFMVLADSWFIDGERPEIAERANKISRIQVLLDDFLVKKPNHKLGIAIILTKSDLVSQDKHEELMSRAMSHFARTIQLVKKNSLSGIILPVSVVGSGNATAEKSKIKGTRIPKVKTKLRDEDGTYPRPMSVELPLFFCIKSSLEGEIRQRETSILILNKQKTDGKRERDEAIRQRAEAKSKKDLAQKQNESAAQKSSKVDDLMSRWRGQKSFGEEARHHADEVKKHANEADKLADKMQRLISTDEALSSQIEEINKEILFLQQIVAHLSARIGGAGWKIT